MSIESDPVGAPTCPGRSSSLMPRRTFCGLTAGASVLALGGCAREHKTLPNIVMMVLDTVRASNLRAWGYGRATTPQLDAFLKTATRYARAYSTAPWTLPSHVSLFTGQYTFEHGVRGYRQKRTSGEVRIADPPLDDTAHTLAERLGEAGYATGAFTANTVFMKERYNLDQGFDRYRVERVRGRALVAQALDWTAAQPSPFFLFVNIMDAHRPYNLAPVPGVALGSVPQDETLLEQFYDATMPGTGPVDADLAARVTRQYDSGIANGDDAFGRLLSGLKETGRFDNSLIILTSDHGEFLGEHGMVEHSKDIYQQTVWVPLAVKRPSQKTAQLHPSPVSLAQVPATALQTARLPQPPKMAPPLGAATTGFPVIAENYYARTWDYENAIWGHRYRRIRTALIEEDWKLIHSSDGQHELFNVVEDPGEIHNLFGAKSERANAMLARLAAVKPLSTEDTAPEPPAPQDELTEEEKEEFRALGYLHDDEDNQEPTAPTGPLPPP